MFNEILCVVSYHCANYLCRLPNKLMFYACMGMDIDVESDDLVKLRLIAAKHIYMMYEN